MFGKALLILLCVVGIWYGISKVVTQVRKKKKKFQPVVTPESTKSVEELIFCQACTTYVSYNYQTCKRKDCPFHYGNSKKEMFLV